MIPYRKSGKLRTFLSGKKSNENHKLLLENYLLFPIPINKKIFNVYFEK